MKIVGAADLHLDSAMVGSWNSREGIWDNWVESFSQLNRLVDVVNEEDADLLVIAGDVFHTGRPTAEAVYRTTSAFSRLNRAKVVMTNGNHDQATVVGQHRTPIDAYIAGQPWCYHVAGNTEFIEYDGIGLVLAPWYRVAGTTKLDATSQILRDDILRGFDDAAQRGFPSMMFGHVLLSEAVFSSGIRSSELKMMPSVLEASVPVSLLEDGPTLYNALGHVHRHQHVANKTSYLGSTYKVDFGEMNEQKGCTIYEISDDGSLETRFVPFRVRELYAIDLSSGISLNESVVEQLQNRDILRLVLPSNSDLDRVSNKIVRELEERGVYVEYRYTPRENKPERKALQGIGLDTSPINVFSKYVQENLDEGDEPDRVMNIFREVYSEANQ